MPAPLSRSCTHDIPLPLIVLRRCQYSRCCYGSLPAVKFPTLVAGGGRVVNAAVQPTVIVASLFAGLALKICSPVVAIGNLKDPAVLVAVNLVLLVVTMMAAAIPANRAASIQPADALRID